MIMTENVRCKNSQSSPQGKDNRKKGDSEGFGKMIFKTT